MLLSWAIRTSLLLNLLLLPQIGHSIDSKANPQKPNIVFILTDDQDLHLNSLDYLPFVRKHLIDRGTSFTRHYCTVALCCPSRVTLWTGKHAHNTVRTFLTKRNSSIHYLQYINHQIECYKCITSIW